jgi:hypothetical protein
MVLEGNIVYLNEIEVFPLALSFLDEYIMCEDCVERIADCTCRYMQKHSTTEEAWPL